MGYIYKIVNDINDKIYVGKTTRQLKTRFQEHLEKMYQRDTHLYRAMRKYGAQYFHIQEIQFCKNDLLNQREIYWIKQMKSYQNGYNETRGGEGTLIIDYEAQIKPYLYKNLSTQEISNITGISQTTICKCLKGLFSKEQIKQRANKLIGEKNSVAIEQYDLEGNLIQQYPSLKSIPNICHRNISDVLYGRRKSAGGYLWKRKDDITPIERLVLNNKNKHKINLIN